MPCAPLPKYIPAYIPADIACATLGELNWIALHPDVRSRDAVLAWIETRKKELQTYQLLTGDHDERDHPF